LGRKKMGRLLISESSEGKEEEENDRATADPGDPEWNKEVTTEDLLEVSYDEDYWFGKADDEWYEKTEW
jgi:hypothetical protein